MAYVLGFWFADGCIYRGRIFDITLHKKDKYILKKIADEL
nr:MAG TPA: RRNA intron-encoded endonuclease [Caudoviricetes sp.]